MKALDWTVGISARALVHLLRFVIPLVSDRAVGRFLRLVERIVYVVTGDKAAAGAVAEVADIFESGPPYTTTVRKLIAGMEPEIVESALKSLARASPYGAA